MVKVLRVKLDMTSKQEEESIKIKHTSSVRVTTNHQAPCKPYFCLLSLYEVPENPGSVGTVFFLMSSSSE